MKRILTFTLFAAIPFLGISQTVEQINKPTVAEIDEIAPFNDGLAAVRKGNQWGFIDSEGQLVIGFRDDLVWNKQPNKDNFGVEGIEVPKFSDGLCVVKEMKDDDIPRYGFIDNTGKIIIKPEFLNVSQFDNGYATGIYENKTLRGKNAFQLNIYDYDFTEVVINKSGEMVWPVQERDNIVMSKKMYKLPELQAKMISKYLLAVKDKNDRWKIVKPELKD